MDGMHNTFGEKLGDMIDLLEAMTQALMLNAMDEYQERIPLLSSLMEVCFPAIIMAYSDPMLKEVADDATYWSDQLGRIIEALNNDDKFAKIDVLYQETRANLVAFSEMIKGSEIAAQTV